MVTSYSLSRVCRNRAAFLANVKISELRITFEQPLFFTSTRRASNSWGEDDARPSRAPTLVGSAELVMGHAADAGQGVQDAAFAQLVPIVLQEALNGGGRGLGQADMEEDGWPVAATGGRVRSRVHRQYLRIGGLINLVTIDAFDAGSKQPEFKICAVKASSRKKLRFQPTRNPCPSFRWSRFSVKSPPSPHSIRSFRPDHTPQPEPTPDPTPTATR